MARRLLGRAPAICTDSTLGCVGAVATLRRKRAQGMSERVVATCSLHVAVRAMRSEAIGSLAVGSGSVPAPGLLGDFVIANLFASGARVKRSWRY